MADAKKTTKAAAKTDDKKTAAAATTTKAKAVDTGKKAVPKKAAPAKKKAVAKSKKAQPVKKVDKKGVIAKHQSHGKDTGSPQVQIALLTEKILRLTDHLKDHAKDKHSRRGLIGMVGKRRKLLKYLQMHDPVKHSEVTRALGLRK